MSPLVPLNYLAKRSANQTHTQFVHISPYETTLNKFEKCDDYVTRLSQGGPIEARVLAAS